MPNKTRKKVIVNVKVLPGEPIDGTGRVCIHLFVQDECGSFVEPHGLLPVFTQDEDGNSIQVKQIVRAGPVRGRLVCDRRRDPAPVTRGGVTTITPHTDDPYAVTCPTCMKSSEYLEMMARLEGNVVK